MLFVIALFIFIIMTIKLVNVRNIIVEMVNEIRLCMSNVNIAKEKYQAVQRQAIGLAGKATQNEGNTYKDIRNAGGEFKASDLKALGQLYPDLKDKLDSTARMVENLYSDYQTRQTELNEKITIYNTFISKFPDSVFAGILGYKEDSIIDEENLYKSKEFSRTADVDISEFV